MELNEVLHGFRLDAVTDLPEFNAKAYRMTYLKNGADLLWLDRDDDNKTFAIAFKTIPENSTGVFHIIEHSVLCGSDKYPVKEPFVDLLKGSLQTFLNAFTFPDKTMYPVSSENDKDFLNLIDVYLDAVLHPLSISDPHAFRQEGWHYEMDSIDDELRYNGVVFNEMKGAYADADSVLSNAVFGALFPDNCYGYDSGGDPSVIPNLTYEEYCACHAKYYHPSNARIFLDGKINLNDVLEKISSFISQYDRLDINSDIPMQQPVSPEKVVERYEIGPGESEEDKGTIAEGWSFGTFADRDKMMAVTVIADYLCGSNETPMKKALLEKGLCEDVDFTLTDGIQQSVVVISALNAKDGAESEIREIIMNTLREPLEHGFDRKRLESIINHYEFINREKNFGSMPKGIVYAIMSMETWLYGADPTSSFVNEPMFRTLREGMDNGYFESVIREVFFDNTHRVQVRLIPSKTLGEERAAARAAKLAAIKASWSDEEKQAVIDGFHSFREKQSADNTPEQLATLPKLSLSDIEEDVPPLPEDVFEEDGITVLNQNVDTNGITYIDLYFSLSDIPAEDIPVYSAWASLLGELPTEKHSAIELESEIDSTMGHFGASVVCFAKKEKATPYFTISAALLNSSKGKTVELLGEIMSQTRFDDEQQISQIITQEKMGLEDSITMSGNSIAAGRVLASFWEKCVLAESITGIDFLRWLQKAEKGDKAELCRIFAAIASKVISRDRLTISITGEPDREFISSIINMLPSVPMGEPVSYALKPRKNEAFIIPAEIGFAAKCSVIDGIDCNLDASMAVASQMLTYEYLWNTVRVKGGAYGTRGSIDNYGSVIFTSYRDPQAAQSLVVFENTPAELRKTCTESKSIDNFIISTIAGMQILNTPAKAGRRHAANYFSGRDGSSFRRKMRSDVLHTTKEIILRDADLIEQALKNAGYCVVGGKNIIDSCGDIFDSVESVSCD